MPFQNIHTNEYANTIRTTGHGSDYFGACELCQKHCSEIHFLTNRRVSIRPDGTRIFCISSTGCYGHKNCLIERFGSAIEESSLQRSNNVFLAPINVSIHP